ncbi:tail fiber domain-containing protein [Candidatus Saccharibacteria bacterium]|nr:tail fiber domain-containing protein [Candidatus Saccharibacteria bacterium]
MEDQTQTLDTSLGRRINWLRVLADLLIITTLLGVIAIILMLWRINNLPSQTSNVSTTTPVANGSITSAKLAAGSVGLDQLSPDIASFLQNALQNPGGSATNIVGACTYFVVCNTPIVEQANMAIQSVNPYFVGAQIRGAKGQVNDILQVQNSSGYPLVNVNANGQVGINYPLPQTTLAVNGTAQFVGHTATGNASAIDNPSILTPLTGTPVIRVQGVQERVSSLTPGYNFYTGASSEYFVDLGQSATSQYFTGGYQAGEIVSGNPQNYLALAGNAGLAVHEGTGNIGLMGGVMGYAYNNSSGTINAAAGTFGYLKNNDNGTISTGNGAAGLVENNGGGTIDVANGLSGVIYNGGLLGSGTGNMGNANGVTAGVFNKGSGNISNVSVVDIQRVTNTGSGSIAAVHGLYVADQSGVATTSESYNIYSRGQASKNVLDGALSVGNDPTVFGTNSRLMVNHNTSFGWQTTDNAAIAQINVTGANTALVLQGSAFSTGDLQQWQNFAGTVLGRVTQSGAMAIGSSTSPTNKLTVTDTTTNVAKFNGSGGTQCTVVTGTGWSCSSDESLKTNILNITNGLDIINKLQGVTYNWKADPNGTQQDGFIAQDIQKVLPELVTTDSDGKLSLNKDGIMPFIVEAVKQQSGNIDKANQQLADQGLQLANLTEELKAVSTKVGEQDNEINDLKARVQILEQKLNSSSNQTPNPTP